MNDDDDDDNHKTNLTRWLTILLMLLPHLAVAQSTTGLSSGAVSVGTSPIIGICPGGDVLYNNGGIVRCKTNVAHPQEYGAFCDGVTDDTTALALWASALTTRSGYIPSGSNCITKSPITFPSGTNLTILGDSPGNSRTHLFWHSHNGRHIYFWPAIGNIRIGAVG